MILLIMTDGRASYFSQTLDSAISNLKIDDELTIVVNDDSAKESYSSFLKSSLDRKGEKYFITPTLPSKSGFGGAINNAWNFLNSLKNTDDFVFHLEDDFLFNQKINISELKTILQLKKNIQQVALRRQPWNELEANAGGIVESNPESYFDKSHENIHWLEHRNFFTTNPCLYRRSLCREGWPVVKYSEGIFSKKLLNKDKDFCSAYFGSRNSGELVRHIGFERNGHGY